MTLDNRFTVIITENTFCDQPCFATAYVESIIVVKLFDTFSRRLEAVDDVGDKLSSLMLGLCTTKACSALDEEEDCGDNPS